jgi:hypothetical protein
MSRVSIQQTTYYIELPFEVPHAEGILMRFDDDAGPFAGWEDFPFGDYLGASNPDPGPIRPSTWITMRDADWQQSAATLAAAKAFPELPQALVGGPHELITAQRTVARVTRFTEAPSEVDSPWLREQLDRALDHLNLYLVGRSFASNLSKVHPILLEHLSPVIAATDGLVEDIARGRAGLQNRFLLTDASRPDFPIEETAPTTRAQMDFAQSISGTFGSLMPSAEYIIRARQAAYGMATRQAALDAGIGVELLVSAVLQEAGVRGWLTADEVANIQTLAKNFALRLKRYFARLCGFDSNVDQGADELGAWWREGYSLRNAVAHAGHTPSPVEAAKAVGAAESLLIATWKAVTARLEQGGPPSA